MEVLLLIVLALYRGVLIVVDVVIVDVVVVGVCRAIVVGPVQ